MVLGNWFINEEGFGNNQHFSERLFISRSSCSKTFVDGQEIYYWMAEIPKYKWLHFSDIEAFNRLFIYALGKYNIEFREELYNASLQKQKEILAIERIINLEAERYYWGLGT